MNVYVGIPTFVAVDERRNYTRIQKKGSKPHGSETSLRNINWSVLEQVPAKLKRYFSRSAHKKSTGMRKLKAIKKDGEENGQSQAPDNQESVVVIC
jgi:hypothetical protein